MRAGNARVPMNRRQQIYEASQCIPPLQLLLAGVVLLPDTRPTRFWFVIVRIITSSKRILHLADGLSSVSTDASKARKTGFRP